VKIGKDNASHSVLIFTFERYSKSLGQRTSSNFFFVDLANSALVRKPPADSSMKVVRECRSVKKSLGALRKSLRCLALNQPHPSHPNLDSNLTKILQNTLVRGAGISVIVTAKSYAQNPVEALSAIRFGAYVGGHRTEDIDESFGNNADDSRWASSHSSKQASQRKEIENQHKKITSNKNGLTSIEIMDDDSRNISMASSDSFEELEKVLQVLKEIPAKYLGLPQKGGNNGNELSKLSSLLDIAVEKIGEKLTLANKDLKNSGFNASLSSMEMQRQLEAVTNEIETMKYDGHLATQIQTDLRKAQEELKRLAIGMEDSSHNSSSITPTKSALESHLERNSADRGAGVHKPRERSPLRPGAAEPSRYLKADIPSRRASYNDNEEINHLKAQLAELTKANEILKQEKTATEKELSAVREELKGTLEYNIIIGLLIHFVISYQIGFISIIKT
jgi:Kinesin motor domain